MLYQIYESQRALMAPFSEFASATSKLYSHPLSPFAHTPLAQRVSASLDLMHRLAKEYEKPPFGISTVKVNGVDVAVTGTIDGLGRVGQVGGVDFKALAADCPRIGMNLKVDYRAGSQSRMRSKIDKVESTLGRKLST